MVVRRCVVTCAAAALALVLAVRSVESSEVEMPHVRVANDSLRAMLADGIEKSETLRALVARIQAAPVLAFVNCAPSLSRTLSGRVGLVSRVGEIRYVRVDIRCSLPPVRRMGVLAHELQHTLEIGEDPSVVDTDTMELYYERFGYAIGRDGAHRAFETDAAQEIQRRVQAELARAGNKTPSPAE